MRTFYSFCLILSALTALVGAQTPQAQVPPHQLSSAEWFQRANNQMNLRMPGSAPFHMKVTFQAFPGVELLDPKEQSDFVAGDGIYEETWIAPHQWRREVTLAGYHAVETESGRARKMMANSSYEPSRVLMLLRALLSPVPRGLLSADTISEGESRWKIDHLTKGDLSLVRIGSSDASDVGITFHVGYYFLPKGLLVIEDNLGITTSWENDVIFSGRVVPRHLTIKAAGFKVGSADRDLLTADVTIEAAPQTDSGFFDLPCAEADPGMTLRPLQGFASIPQPAGDPPVWQGNRNAELTLWGVIDRTGRFRELEVIGAVDADAIQKFMELYRKSRYRPAQIDGNQCEVGTFTTVTRTMRGAIN